VHEKQKYGVDVQFPIQRYVMGLTSATVPNRDDEYPRDETGAYPSSYQGLKTHHCTNPLYAAQLPAPPAGMDPSTWSPSADDLCTLAPGPRSSKVVFYAHIGGVPHELLQASDGTQKDTLEAADWKLILGNDPDTFDDTGIDPHMVESFTPRTNVAVPPGRTGVSLPTAKVGADPINGREWVTQQNGVVDLEYACTFKLSQPRDCSSAAQKADPTLTDSCDCLGGFPTGDVPAVCDATTPTTQDYAKAYPTIRELELAKLLGDQGDQVNEGIVSSLCPIHTEEETPGDPLFGYRPAMNTIVNRLRTALAGQCLPEVLDQVPDADGGSTVNCLILGTFPPGTNAPQRCSDVPGYTDVDSIVLAHFDDDNPSLTSELTCELNQLPADSSCDTGSEVGWCYVDNRTGGLCPQAIVFSPHALVDSVFTHLTCLEASKADLGDGSAGSASP
jgi:hypothetical protein